MKAGVEQARMTSGRTSAVREVTAQSARKEIVENLIYTSKRTVYEHDINML